MGKWADNDVMAYCCDVYQLFNSEGSCDEKEDWMLSYEFLNEERTVIIVEENEPDFGFALQKTKRLYFGFKGVHLNTHDIADRESLLKLILTNYKIENYFGFQKQASNCLELVLTKLKQLEEKEDDDDEFVYEVIFCGYSIGGSIAATAFINLCTRKRLNAETPNIPSDSIMTLQSIPVDVYSEVHPCFREFGIDRKVKFDSSHEFYCITHGAALFGNEKNKKYCIKQKLPAGIFNIIHEKDPVPKLFYHFMPTEYQDIKANNGYSIGNFLILSYYNGKFCPKKIDSKDNKSIEDFFNKTTNFPFDMSYHLLHIYKRPVNPGNTELDVINRINKDIESLKKSYVCTDYIGEGSFGIVVKAIENNDLFAIKKLKGKYHNNDRDNREIVNLGKVTNQHVVKFVEHFCFKSTLYLVFEYCLFGSLESYILSRTDRLGNEEIRILLSQLLNGLLAIHDKNIIHRDIKPANILVTSLRNGDTCYKISDFGSSVGYEGHSKLLSTVGTPLYTSPEIYLASKKGMTKVTVDDTTDIFSLGAVILFCTKKDTPWNEKQYCDLIEGGFSEIMFTDYENEPLELKEILDIMLQTRYWNRWSARYLLIHPFMTGDENSIFYLMEPVKYIQSTFNQSIFFKMKNYSI